MLTETERNRVFDRYWQKDHPNIVIVPYVLDPGEIDSLGASEALKKAHRMAIEGTYYRLSCNPIVVVDGVVNPNLNTNAITPSVFCLPKGDQRVPTITLASVIAKVFRDREMVRLASIYPGYGFEKHKGYGTAEHQRGINAHGLCDIHRRSYEPMRTLVQAANPVRPAWDIE
jgi:ribonuclease HII